MKTNKQTNIKYIFSMIIMSSLITNFTYAETIRDENVVSSSTINHQPSTIK